MSRSNATRWSGGRPLKTTHWQLVYPRLLITCARHCRIPCPRFNLEVVAFFNSPNDKLPYDLFQSFLNSSGAAAAHSRAV